MKLTNAEENYLLAIHRLSNGGKVSTNQLAQEIGIAAPSVTDMIQKLAEKEYVRYEKYKGVSLLPTGSKIAKSLSSTKTLWKDFLKNHLQLDLQETRLLLDQLQHIQSPNFENQFQAYLASPIQPKMREKNTEQALQEEDLFADRQRLLVKELKQDVQEKRVTDRTISQKSLFDCKVGDKVFLVGVQSNFIDASELLTFARLPLGVKAEVKNFFAFDESILISFANTEQLVSKRLAEIIVVK